MFFGLKKVFSGMVSIAVVGAAVFLICKGGNALIAIAITAIGCHWGGKLFGKGNVNHELKDKEEKIKKLEEEVNNLSNSVINSFRFVPTLELTLLKTQSTVQKYITRTLQQQAAKFHRPCNMEYHGVFSEDIGQSWSFDLKKLRFFYRKEDNTIEIYGAIPKVTLSYNNQKWPMEGRVYQMKYNKNNPDIAEEIFWEPQNDVVYKAQIKNLEADEIKKLERSFEYASRDQASNSPWMQEMSGFAEQQLKMLFSNLFNCNVEIFPNTSSSKAKRLDDFQKDLACHKLIDAGIAENTAQRMLAKYFHK